MIEKNIIGFWGYPHPKLIEKYKKMYPTAQWVDFDIDYGFAKQDLLPESYCSIIKNIVNIAILIYTKRRGEILAFCCL